MTTNWLTYSTSINSTNWLNSTSINSTIWLNEPTHPSGYLIIIGTNQTGIMFDPIGTGSLYYHAIPTTRTWHALPVQQNVAVWSTPRPRDELAQSRIAREVLARPALIRGRRALRKSIDLYRKFRPAAEIKAFLDGQPIIIKGHRFDYRMRKRGDLLQHTMYPDSPHIPYDLHLVDKTSGHSLAKGCVIVPDTPVIDQLLALILHVQDADEEAVVIHTTNWSPRLPDHLIRPLLARAA